MHAEVVPRPTGSTLAPRYTRPNKGGGRRRQTASASASPPPRLNPGVQESQYSDYEEHYTTQSYLVPKSNILDIGCGPGNNAKFLIEIDGGYKIEGLDLSVELINIAKRTVPGCHFWVQDIRDIDPDKEYDAIVASFCIVHLSDEETAIFLGKLSKMLKENGSLYLSFMEGKKAGFETTSFSEDNIFFNYHRFSR